MKTIIAGFCLVAGFSLTTFGQEAKVKKEQYPYHVISKDIQRMQFKNAAHEPAKVVTGNVVSVSAKDIHKIGGKRSSSPPAAIKRNGTPSWVISKGVVRMQYEGNQYDKGKSE